MEHEIIRKQRSTIAGLERQQAEIKHAMSIECNKLQGMLEMAEAFQKDSDIERQIDDMVGTSKPSERRMRLGAKKRAIYALIDMEVNNLNDIVERISGTDITRTYARDVIRIAIENKDFYGEVEGIFSIAPPGEKILTGAPTPSGWDEYSHLFKGHEQNSPDAETSGEDSGDATTSLEF